LKKIQRNHFVIHGSNKILDESAIQIMGQKLFWLVDVLHHYKIILSFKGIDYLSSAALGKFITLQKMIQAANGKLVLCEIIPEVFENFEITRLDCFFKITKSEADALASF